MNSARSRSVVFAVLVLNAAAGHAHTLTNTIVSVRMTHPGVVNITIAAEADPLIAKLEALAGVSASHPPTTAADRRERIASLFPTLRAHIDARGAGTPLVLDLQDVTVDDTAQTQILMTARMPNGPPAFTWRSTFIFGAYQLAITSGDAVKVAHWLQGPQASTPIALEPSRAGARTSAVWLTRIGRGLAMGALVVYVLCRRRSAHRLAGG